jgi:hypothetical protein
MHPRRVIRNGIAERIIQAGTALGDRVFPSREIPAAVKTLLAEGPICIVYTRSEHIKPEDYPASGFDSGVRRTLEIAVEITATGSTLVDDALDDLAEEVEALLENWEPQGMPTAEIRLVSTQIDSTDEFEQPLGGALLMFEAKYWRAYRTDTTEGYCPRETYVIANGEGPSLVAVCSGDCDCADCS